MRLRAEDGTDFVHALEDAHHRLFVELGALREERVAAEVVDPKEVCAAFGRRGDDLRRLDLDEALRVQCLAERRDGARGKPKALADYRMTERDRCGVESRRQRLLQLRPMQLDRRPLSRFGEHADLRVAHLHPAGRLLARHR